MTDTTDIEALRRRSNNLRTADQTDAFIDLLLGKLEAERQRADAADSRLHEVSVHCANVEAELAALKGDQVPVALIDDRQGSGGFYLTIYGKKLNLKHGTELFTHPHLPVVLPQPFAVRTGHPFNECERTAMIPDDKGNWLSKFAVEHAIKMAGGIVKDGE